jgi:hypothetical protein
VQAVITSRTTGGAMARRLLPMAILIPWSLWRDAAGLGRCAFLERNSTFRVQIGGRGDENGLAPGATNLFNFVVSANNHFSGMNLQAKVSFNRVGAGRWQVADVFKQVNRGLSAQLVA